VQTNLLDDDGPGGATVVALGCLGVLGFFFFSLGFLAGWLIWG